jgi:hypothetical protein
MALFTIELHGNGIHAGLGKVSKSAYQFWKDRNDLWDATDPNGNFDFKSIGASKTTNLSHFWNYNDKVSFSGLELFTEASILLIIFDSERNVVLEKTLDQLLLERQQTDEFAELTESLDEFYIRTYSPQESDLPAGYYFNWSRAGTGQWFSADVTLENSGAFDISKLQFNSVDFEGDEFLVEVIYDGEKLSNNEYNIGWADPQISFEVSENKKGLSKAWKYELY